jgi:hypothetical protein
MKTKNFGLAAVAFLIAIGAASASMFTLKNVFVKAKMTTDPSTTVCIDSGVQCESSGSQTCTVQFTVVSGTDHVATGTSFHPYEPSSCSIELKNNSNTTLISSVSGIDRLVQN